MSYHGLTTVSSVGARCLTNIFSRYFGSLSVKFISNTLRAASLQYSLIRVSDEMPEMEYDALATS